MSMKKLMIFIICALLILPYSVIAYGAEADEDLVKTVNGCYDIDAPEYETDIALLVNADTSVKAMVEQPLSWLWIL